MRFFRSFFVVLLALAWAPMSLHCRLESLPGVEVFHCVAEQAAHQDTDAQSDDCQDCGCCSFEAGRWQVAKQQSIVPVAVLSLLVEHSFPDASRSLPPEVCVGVLTAAPPDLPVALQFLLSPGLMPRAPSFLS